MSTITTLADYKRTRRETGYTATQAIKINRTKQAEYEGRIRFEWVADQEPDISWMDEDDLMHLEAGDMVILGCSAYVPKFCGHCGHEMNDEWEWADSLSGIVVTGESDPYCRLVESELAEGHLV